MSSQNTSNYRRRRKENLIEVCGGECRLCGYKKTASALEFHHIDPSQKDFGIASNGNCHDLEKDLNEVKKCILVCANCHREIHDGLYEQDFLYERQFFDEDFADFLRMDKIEKTTAKEYFCEICQKPITRYSNSGLCQDCFSKSRRTVERPSRQELKDLIRTMPFTKIGEKFGVSDNAIRKWCKLENLPSKVTEIKNFSDAEWEKI